MPPDRELVSRCLAGEVAATRELIGRFENDVFAICARTLRHRHDAEDAAQETFVRVFRSLHRWDPERPLKPWVLTIAVNRCRTALARNRVRPRPVEYAAEVPAAEVPEPADDLAGGIAEALDGLRDDHRQAFVLFHETGRPYDEIAELMGRPVGTIKTWLHRARAQVLAALRSRGLVTGSEDVTPT